MADSEDTQQPAIRYPYREDGRLIIPSNSRTLSDLVFEPDPDSPGIYTAWINLCRVGSREEQDDTPEKPLDRET